MKYLTTAFLALITTFATSANATTYPQLECRDLKWDIEMHGKSELNGLSFVSDDPRATIPTIDFSFGSNRYVELAGVAQLKVKAVKKEGDNFSFTTRDEIDHIGRYVDHRNAFKFELNKVGKGKYEIMMFEDAYGGTLGDRKLYWKPYHEFVKDMEDTSHILYTLDEESVKARDAFQCVD